MVTAGCVFGVAPAVASAAEPQQAASGNWAGYVVNDSTGKDFKSVSASWTQPTANCTSAGQYAAFWVGLGGTGQTEKLEQAGTEAECGNDGSPSYFAWYELVPSAPVTLGLSVRPGDQIYTRVVVDGSHVTISLSNQTTGQSTTKNLTMSDPDTSSAEWIAEAPSQCEQGVSNCQELPLADFGTVKFNNAYTTDTAGHTGSVSDSQWSPVAVTLDGGDGSQGFGDSEFVSASGSAGASPSNLSSTGSSFSVSYAGDGSSDPAAATPVTATAVATPAAVTVAATAVVVAATAVVAMATAVVATAMAVVATAAATPVAMATTTAVTVGEPRTRLPSPPPSDRLTQGTIPGGWSSWPSLKRRSSCFSGSSSGSSS